MLSFKRIPAALFAGPLLVIILAACQNTPIPTSTRPTSPSQEPLIPTSTRPARVFAVPPNFTFEGITFRDGESSRAQGWSGRLVPRGEPDGLPEHIDISQEPDPASDSLLEPHIYILPAGEFEESAALREYLARQEQPLSPGESIPLIATGNLAVGCDQVLRAQVVPMRFQNGSGVRFITEYQCQRTAITNGALAYAYQGLTDDGQTYVSVVIPISHPSLPSPDDDLSIIPGFDVTTNQFTGDFADYAATVANGLNSATPDSFQRSLTTLDEIIQSMEVKPPLPLASAFTPTPAAPRPTPGLPVTPAAAGMPPNMSQDGITITLDPAVAASWTAARIPGDPSGAAGLQKPPFIQFELQRYAIYNRSGQALIFISPTYNLTERRHEQYLLQIAQLKDLLNRRPGTVAVGGSPVDGIPRVSLSELDEGVQYFLARIAYFDFRNGTGVRYITEYTWENYPASNETLQYVYQGLTTDGRYLISIHMPISHPYLPDHPQAQVSQAEREAFIGNMGPYLTGITDTFNTAAPSAFTPDLDLLDLLVKSIRVQPIDF